MYTRLSVLELSSSESHVNEAYNNGNKMTGKELTKAITKYVCTWFYRSYCYNDSPSCACLELRAIQPVQLLLSCFSLFMMFEVNYIYLWFDYHFDYLHYVDVRLSCFTTLCRIAHTVRSEYVKDEAGPVRRLRRLYHCAAYNLLVAVIMCTQSKQDFYTVFLFKEDTAKVSIPFRTLLIHRYTLVVTATCVNYPSLPLQHLQPLLIWQWSSFYCTGTNALGQHYGFGEELHLCSGAGCSVRSQEAAVSCEGGSPTR